jgi:nitroreductase
MSIDLIHQRVSSPVLDLPAPTEQQREQIIKAALRAPDHGALRPWRFIWIEGEARGRFADILVKAATQEDRGEQAIAKAHKMPLRAPVLLAVISSPKPSPKIPLVDQRYSAAAAAQNVLLACESLDYASIWRTGWPVESQSVKHQLGLDTQEEIVGLIYIGTRRGQARSVEALEVSDYMSQL